MTQQQDEILVYEGRRYPLMTYPLESAFSPEGKPHFVSSSTNNYRGYVATWTIDGDRLFLSSIIGDICKSRTSDCWSQPNCGWARECATAKATPEFLFGCSSPVFAKWFSGELRVPSGPRVARRHLSIFPEYEEYWVWTVLDGVASERWVQSDAECLALRQDQREEQLAAKMGFFSRLLKSFT